MKKNILGPLIISLLIIGTSFFVLTTDFEKESDKTDTVQPKNNEPIAFCLKKDRLRDDQSDKAKWIAGKRDAGTHG